MQKPVVIACFLALVACKGDKKPDESGSALPKGGKGMPTAADCENVGNKFVQRSMEKASPDLSDADRVELHAISEEASSIVVELCKTDGWSGDAVACILAAKAPELECKDKLTPAHYAKIEERMRPINMKGMGGQPTPAGSAAPAGSGSAP